MQLLVLIWWRCGRCWSWSQNYLSAFTVTYDLIFLWTLKTSLSRFSLFSPLSSPLLFSLISPLLFSPLLSSPLLSSFLLSSLLLTSPSLMRFLMRYHAFWLHNLLLNFLLMVRCKDGGVLILKGAGDWVYSMVIGRCIVWCMQVGCFVGRRWL